MLIIRVVFVISAVMLASSYSEMQTASNHNAAMESSTAIQQGSQQAVWYLMIPSIIAGAIVIIDLLWKRKRLQMLGGLFFGFLTGLAIMGVFNYIYELALDPDNHPNKETFKLVQAFIDICIVYFCISVVMQTKDDFRFIIPYVEFTKQSKGANPILLDTSVIIDGRVTDIINTKIIQSELIVPRFVLSELQSIADSQDKLKRNRGRRGLEVLQKLQQNKNAEVTISDLATISVDKARDVDSKLVALAEHLDAQIMTNDYNLNKVAQLRGIEILNINDLANALKPIVLPGEKMIVKIIRAGEEPHQGVAYLDDGTMIVVDHGRDFIEQTVEITVTSALQTSAGRMIFGRIAK